MTRRDLLLGAGIVLLLAVAVVRLAVPDRERLRPLSVQGLDIPTEPIAQGETILRETSWQPPDDVYLLGWTPWYGAAGSGAQLVLLDGSTRLFVFGDSPARLGNAFLPSGAAYRLKKGRSLTLRFTITNTGPPTHTLGASAVVYFVPAEGN